MDGTRYRLCTRWWCPRTCGNSHWLEDEDVVEQEGGVGEEEVLHLPPHPHYHYASSKKLLVIFWWYRLLREKTET